MDAATLLTRLCALIDAHDWDALPALLHDDFSCRYVHTGEVFDRAAWVRLNAGYPGFDRMVLEDLVGSGDRAVARCHVTAAGSADFEVASFVTSLDGRVRQLTEVWTEVAQTAPPGSRPDGRSPLAPSDHL